LGTATRKCLPLNVLKPTKAIESLLRQAYPSFLGMIEEPMSVAWKLAELHDDL